MDDTVDISVDLGAMVQRVHSLRRAGQRPEAVYVDPVIYHGIEMFLQDRSDDPAVHLVLRRDPTHGILLVGVPVVRIGCSVVVTLAGGPISPLTIVPDPK